MFFFNSRFSNLLFLITILLFNNQVTAVYFLNQIRRIEYSTFHLEVSSGITNTNHREKRITVEDLVSDHLGNSKKWS